MGDSITIFGQKKQTGYLEFRKIAYFDTFSQYGAEVSATGWVSGTGAKKTLTVNNKLTLARGKLSLTNIEGGTVQLLGGNSDLWNMNVNEIILSWTNLSDSYRFVYIDPLPSAGMRVIDGKSLKDNDYEKIFSGTLSTEDITAAQDKTLRPYHPTHSCGEPEWNWADDCSKATATFTCKDCGAVKTEKIPATGHDYGKWTELDENEHQRVCANDASLFIGLRSNLKTRPTPERRLQTTSPTTPCRSTAILP